MIARVVSMIARVTGGRGLLRLSMRSLGLVHHGQVIGHLLLFGHGIAGTGPHARVVMCVQMGGH